MKTKDLAGLIEWMISDQIDALNEESGIFRFDQVSWEIFTAGVKEVDVVPSIMRARLVNDVVVIPLEIATSENVLYTPYIIQECAAIIPQMGSAPIEFEYQGARFEIHGGSPQYTVLVLKS